MRYNTAPETCLDAHKNVATPRFDKARRLLEAGLVVLEDDGSYTVRSESDSSRGYIVTPRTSDAPAQCSCPDFTHRQSKTGGRCAHLWAARLHVQQLRERRRLTLAELARPTVRAAAKALGACTRKIEQAQARLRRSALCGTVADWPGGAAHP
jgi:predicted nucleic acid-binding Zn finger protein